MSDDPGARRSKLSGPKQALLQRRLRGEGRAAAVTPAIPPRPDPTWAPLSYAQERLWFLEQLEPGTALYVIPATLPLRGDVDAGALERSLNEIVARHEVLRTTFTAAHGQPFQRIAPALTLPLTVVDLTALPTAERPSRARAILTHLTGRPFDLERGPLLRAALLLDTEAAEHTLILAMHHIVSDAWSLRLLFDELLTLYDAFVAGRPSPLPPLPVQYGDYAVWQRGPQQRLVHDEQIQYWRRQLADLATLRLRTDRPRPAVTSYRGASQSLALSARVVEGLRGLSRREGVSLFMAVLAAFATLLSRYTGSDDIVVGTPIAGRTQVETERLIGFFLNTLVLRVDVDGDPEFRALLARVRSVALGAYAHQELPFERLLAELHPERRLGQTPLFQVFFNHFADDHPRRDRPDRLRPEATDARFDLTLYAIERDGGLELQAVYRVDLFADATISRILEHLEALLAAVTEDPRRRLSALPLPWSPERRHVVAPGVADSPATRAAVEASIPARFASIAARDPEHIAVRSRGHTWSYAQLDGVAERIAAAVLDRHGPGEGRVGLLFGHDAPMVAAILGALKAGKTYVPLDRLHPTARLAEIARHAQVAAIVTDAAHVPDAAALGGGVDVVAVETLDTRPAAERVSVSVAPDAAAYILYTSGSTGRPKGVVQSHRNVLHHSLTYAAALGISPSDRLTLLSSYAFDAAVMDIFGALLSGATLCLFDIRERGPAELARWIRDEAITIHHSTPTLYRHLAAAATGGVVPQLRHLVLGGEEVTARDVELSRRLGGPRCTLVNGFGPTESTLALQYFIPAGTALADGVVPIGYPVADTDVQLLNASGEEVGLYGTGEIVIRSEFVALGYWREPELTRAAFRPDPERPARRAYHTGDLGRRLADGTIVFAGRKDRQVKLRGYRIEVGEIEARLLEHPAIRETVVALREDAPGEQRLVAYVVARDSEAVPVMSLHAFLRERLPAYMVPSRVVVLNALPLTATGKIDRRALPVPDGARPDATATFTAPRTSLEESLAAVWAELLGVERVGVTDDFFELGGHSLLMMRLLSRIRERFAVELPLRRMFERPTVAHLAQAVEEARREIDAISPPIQPQPRERYRRTVSAAGELQPPRPAADADPRPHIAEEP